MLEATNITKHFGGVKAVDGCTLSFEKGAVTGLIGPNGAGKSTLFNLLTGFLKPTSGVIRFKNGDISTDSPQKRFKKGLVRSFQIPHEFSRLTVLENLMVVPAYQKGENLLYALFAPHIVKVEEKALRDEANTVLEFLELSDLRHEIAGNLSGGQRKLLELGRTIMSGAEMILLDEPGAGVNRTLLAQLCEKIEILAHDKKISFCIIEHDMDVIARLCDPIIVMAEGKVLATGDFKTIRANEEICAAYLGATLDDDGISAKAIARTSAKSNVQKEETP